MAAVTAAAHWEDTEREERGREILPRGRWRGRERSYPQILQPRCMCIHALMADNEKRKGAEERGWGGFMSSLSAIGFPIAYDADLVVGHHERQLLRVDASHIVYKCGGDMDATRNRAPFPDLGPDHVRFRHLRPHTPHTLRRLARCPSETESEAVISALALALKPSSGHSK